MNETLRLETIFKTWDKNNDGCLDRSEFAGLIKAVNPEVVLSDLQLGLILEEVWNAFPDHINKKGLTFGGLKQLYAEGLADLERDYTQLEPQLKTNGSDTPGSGVRSGRRGSRTSAAAAVAAAVSGIKPITASMISSPRHVDSVEGGRGANNTATTRQPRASDAESTLPARPAIKEEPMSPNSDVFAGLKTPAVSAQQQAAAAAAKQKMESSPGFDDVFENLKTPAVNAANGGAKPAAAVLPGRTPGGGPASIAFCLAMEEISCVHELRFSMKDQELIACLRQALPEGTNSAISYVLPTSLGLAVGVCCHLPEGSSNTEDVQYATAVLQYEPDQIFPAASFGRTSVVIAAPLAVDGDADEAAKAASLTHAGLSVVGIAGRASLAFTVTYPGLGIEEDFLGLPAWQFTEQLENALPADAVAHITALAALPRRRGLTITVGVSFAGLQQAQAFSKRLKEDSGSVFPDCLGSQVVSVTIPVKARPALAARIMLPNVSENAFWGEMEMELVEAIEEALPDGCTAAISDAEPRNQGLVVVGQVALPATASPKEVQRCVTRLQQAQKWAAAAAGSKKVECVGAGNASEFGLTAGAVAIKESIASVRPKASLAPSPSKKEKKEAEKAAAAAAAAAAGGDVEASPSKGRLLGRLFSKKPSAGKESEILGDSGLAPLPPLAGTAIAAAGVTTAGITATRKQASPPDSGKKALGRSVTTAKKDVSRVSPTKERMLNRSLTTTAAAAASSSSSPQRRVSPEQPPMYPPEGSILAGYQRRSLEFDNNTTGAAAAIGLTSAVGGLTLEEYDDNDVPSTSQASVSASASTSPAPVVSEAAAKKGISPAKGKSPASAARNTSPSKKPPASAAAARNTSPGKKPPTAAAARNTSPGKKPSPTAAAPTTSSTSKASTSAAASPAAAAKGKGKPPPLALPSDADLLDQVAQRKVSRTSSRIAPREAASPSAGGQSDTQPPTPGSTTSSMDDGDGRVRFLVGELERILQDPNCGTNDVAFLQESVAKIKSASARHAAHMEIGDRLSQKELYPEALRSFREATMANSADPLAHFRMANTHFAMHQYQEASRCYVTASSCCRPEVDDQLSTKILVNHGITQESLGNMPQAIAFYERAVTINPEHHRGFKLVGSAKYAVGDLEGAKTALRQALRLKPDFAEAYGDLGCTYIAAGDVENASRCLKQAIKLKPELVEPQFNLGNLHRQSHEFDKAIECYDAVLALDPTHWRSLLNRAVVLTCMGENDRAGADLQQATNLSGHLGAGSLGNEVEQLRRMIRSNADWGTISQMMTYIEDRAKQIESGEVYAMAPMMQAAPMGHMMGAHQQHMMGGYPPAGGAYSLPYNAELADTLLRRLPSFESSHRGTASVRSFGARSARSGGGYSVRSGSYTVRSGAPSVRGGFSPNSSTRYGRQGPPLSPNRSPDKLRGWEPPPYVSAHDIGPDIQSRLAQMNVDDVPKLLETIDVPMLQQMQPCSCIALAEIWIEVLESGEILSRSRSRKGMKMCRLGHAEHVLRRLLTRAPPQLFQGTMMALHGQVLCLLDHMQTGYVDLAMLLCVLAAVSDSNLRDRLDLTYKILMWRNSATPDAENPITRKDLVELIATLKMVFEKQHKTTAYLQERRPSAIDSQYIIFGRFQSDLLKFFPQYEALPMLCNPLS